MRLGERSGLQAADMGPPADLAADQAGGFEYLDMFRRRGERHREGLGELADGAVPGGEITDHLPPRRVAERVEDGIELE